MATSYSEIFNAFMYKIEGYKLIQLLTEDRERIIKIYLTAACRKAYKKCKKYADLTDRDDVMQEFHTDLEDDMIDILAECMITEWLRPKLYSDELIESRLNTKDFTEFSPAKLIEQVRATYDLSERASKAAISNYTYSHEDIAELTEP